MVFRYVRGLPAEVPTSRLAVTGVISQQEGIRAQISTHKMEIPSTNRTTTWNEQIESFLASIYSKAFDVLEVKISKIASRPVPSIAPAYNQCAKKFLDEVTTKAVSVFIDKVLRSTSSSSGHFEFEFFHDVDKNDKKQTPPTCLQVYDDDDRRSQLEQMQNFNALQRNIQSRWTLTSNESCLLNLQNKRQQMEQNICSAAKTLAFENVGNDIKSGTCTDLETEKQMEKGSESVTVVSVSNSNIATCGYPGMPNVKKTDSQEAADTDVCEFTGFHPARNLLQSGVSEEQVYSDAIEQLNTCGNDFTEKRLPNFLSQTKFKANFSESLKHKDEVLAESSSLVQVSQHELFNVFVKGSAVEFSTGKDIHEAGPYVTKQLTDNKDQEVPDSHEHRIPDEREESSLFYTLDEMKVDVSGASVEAEDKAKCDEALGCHWFMYPTRGITDLTPSRATLLKLPSIPVCNRPRRVGLSRKQKVPALHSKRLKLSEQ